LPLRDADKENWHYPFHTGSSGTVRTLTATTVDLRRRSLFTGFKKNNYKHELTPEIHHITMAQQSAKSMNMKAASRAMHAPSKAVRYTKATMHIRDTHFRGLAARLAK
jgi:hypothetical protein